MKKGIAIGLAALTALSAAAYAGFGMEAMGGKPVLGHNEELREALDSGSYQDFVDALSEVNPGMADDMTEERFNEMVGRTEAKAEVQNAMDAGDYDAFVDALTKVNPSAADGMTMERFSEMVQHQAVRSAIEDAVENHDYDAWVEAALKLPNGQALVEIVDADDFETLIGLHQSRMNSGFEDPGILPGLLGMGKGPGKGMGPDGRGMGRGPGMGLPSEK
ncbi:MAG: hypothetical protein ABII71_06220 [Candidatus Micrarchaeota archaeon]